RRPRRTPGGKLVVPVVVSRGGKPLDQVDLTSTETGRRGAVRRLLEKAGGALTAGEGGQAGDGGLGPALEVLRRPPGGGGGGDTLRPLLGHFVYERYAPGWRVGRRVWLAALGTDFDCHAFLSLMNEDMLTAARGASDVGEDEDRYALIGRVGAELRLVF